METGHLSSSRGLAVSKSGGLSGRKGIAAPAEVLALGSSHYASAQRSKLARGAARAPPPHSYLAKALTAHMFLGPTPEIATTQHRTEQTTEFL